jgi:hypothetical protein
MYRKELERYQRGRAKDRGDALPLALLSTPYSSRGGYSRCVGGRNSIRRQMKKSELKTGPKTICFISIATMSNPSAHTSEEDFANSFCRQIYQDMLRDALIWERYQKERAYSLFSPVSPMSAAPPAAVSPSVEMPKETDCKEAKSSDVSNSPAAPIGSSVETPCEKPNCEKPKEPKSASISSSPTPSPVPSVDAPISPSAVCASSPAGSSPASSPAPSATAAPTGHDTAEVAFLYRLLDALSELPTEIGVTGVHDTINRLRVADGKSPLPPPKQLAPVTDVHVIQAFKQDGSIKVRLGKHTDASGAETVFARYQSPSFDDFLYRCSSGYKDEELILYYRSTDVLDAKELFRLVGRSLDYRS